MPAPVHVEPMAMGFFVGSLVGLLLVVLELNEVLDGRRMSSPLTGFSDKLSKSLRRSLLLPVRLVGGLVNALVITLLPNRSAPSRKLVDCADGAAGFAAGGGDENRKLSMSD